MSITNEKICPRCGKPYSSIKEVSIRERTYLYAFHYLGYEKVNGKAKLKRKYCYLGPKDKYEYVLKLHSSEGLELKGLADREREIEYLKAILSSLISSKLSGREAKKVERILGAALEKLRRRELELWIERMDHYQA